MVVRVVGIADAITVTNFGKKGECTNDILVCPSNGGKNPGLFVCTLGFC
jgi:hypothetical protein